MNSTASPVSVPATFPERILALLHELADRSGSPTHGPAEDGNGEPLQDDADAALAWIAACAQARADAAEVLAAAWEQVEHRDRMCNELRAMLDAAPTAALLEAVDGVLETTPCDCSHKRRYEAGEHMSGCHLFDLNLARLTQQAQADAAQPVARFAEVFDELGRATAKFPTWPTDPLHAMGVLAEEFGELGKDVLQLVYEPHKTSRENVRKEATQTAAMALRFFASLDRYEYMQGAQHSQAEQQAQAPGARGKQA